jgi:hypothetical protein
MICFPAPMEFVALVLSLFFPLLMLGYAQIKSIRGSGVRFAAGAAAATAIFFTLAIALPGERDLADIFSGLMLLASAFLFWNVVWGLLAFGFTLTMLTALVKEGRPLTGSQWVLAYMQGASLAKFARNRLQLLLGSGMAKTESDKIVATPFGAVAATLVRTTRLLFGIR